MVEFEDYDDEIFVNSIEIETDDTGSLATHAIGAGWTNLRVTGHRHGCIHATVIHNGTRMCFVKVPDPAGPDAAGLLLRLHKEYELGVTLDHPGVARTLGWENIPGLGMGVVTEYIDGTSLSAWLAGNKPSRRQRLQVARQLADTLAYMHSRGVCHRDLKPDNIIIPRNGGQPRIIDFGLADAPDFTAFKVSAGTAQYGAPEQQQAGCCGDKPSDIYALGRILSELRLGALYRVTTIRKCLRTNPSRRPTAAKAAACLSGHPRVSRIATTVALFAAAVALIALWTKHPQDHAVNITTATTNNLADSSIPENTIEQPHSTNTLTPLPTTVQQAEVHTTTITSPDNATTVTTILNDAIAEAMDIINATHLSGENNDLDQQAITHCATSLDTLSRRMRRQVSACGASAFTADSCYNVLWMQINPLLQNKYDSL